MLNLYNMRVVTYTLHFVLRGFCFYFYEFVHKAKCCNCCQICRPKWKSASQKLTTWWLSPGKYRYYTMGDTDDEWRYRNVNWMATGTTDIAAYHCKLILEDREYVGSNSQLVEGGQRENGILSVLCRLGARVTDSRVRCCVERVACSCQSNGN